MSPRIDKLFGQIQRKTERDLYRKSYRSVIKSQQSIYDSVSKNKTNKRKQKISKEILWFFIKVIISILISFLIYSLCNILIPQFNYEISLILGWGELSLFFLLSSLIFIGMYIVRIILWSLKQDYD